jgi:tetratricopeptide (TPR) repeat protein
MAESAIRTQIDALWDFSDVKASEMRFRELLASPLANEDKSEVLTQLGRSLGLQGRFSEAQQVLSDAKDAAPAESRQQVRVLLESGRVNNSSGRAAEAKACFLQAVDLASRIGEEALAIDAAHMTAITSETDEALEWNLRALDMARNANDPAARAWRASVLNNLAWAYHDKGLFETALPLFEEARVCREEMAQPERERIARFAIGRCLRSLKRYEEALIIQRKALQDAGSNGSIGYGEEEVAECLLALGNPTEAAEFFAAAIERLTANGELQNEPERLQRMRELAVLRT